MKCKIKETQGKLKLGVSSNDSIGFVFKTWLKNENTRGWRMAPILNNQVALP